MILPVLLALAGGVLAPPSPRPAPAVQETGEVVPDDRFEVAILLDQLREQAGRLGKEDAAAIQTIDRLRAEFPRSGPHDRSDIATELHRTMRVPRRMARDGTRPRELFLAATRALAEMAPESVEHLVRLIGERNHATDYEVREAILAAVGRTRDARAVEPLLDVLDEFQARLQAAAAGALGEFTNLDQKIRKRIFEDLLKLLASTHAAQQEDPNGSTINDRWNRIAGPAQSSMRKLSGAEVDGPPAWLHWWNKNKKRDWDDKEQAGGRR
ncbi:MAG: hypothetical protein AB1726_02050 [Planctomycetota bacterium]